MIALPLVRPINEVEVQCLENKFVMGYRDGDRAIYVSIYDNLGHSVDVWETISSKWSDLWRQANEHFDSFANDDDLASFVGKIFFVWEGNHTITAWWRHMNKFHALDSIEHIFPHCFVLDARGHAAVLLNAMSDINW